MSTDEPLSRVKLDDALISRLRTVLGDDNGDAFALLWAEYLHLRMCFNDLKNGFGGDDPPMIQVWAISQQFADRYWTLLLEETVLSVCRLTDKRRVSGKKTTSISVLPEWFAAEPGVKNEVEQLVNTAKTAAEVLRIWRNTQLAHTAEKRERPPVTGDETEAAVGAIHEALAFVWHRRLYSEPELPHPTPATAALGEHLAHMHETTTTVAAWLLEAAGHDDSDDIPGAAAAMKRLTGGAETKVTGPRQESDPIVEFLAAAREARKIIDRTARVRADNPSHRDARA